MPTWLCAGVGRAFLALVNYDSADCMSHQARISSIRNLHDMQQKINVSLHLAASIQRMFRHQCLSTV